MSAFSLSIWPAMSGPTSFLGLMLLMSYVPLVEDDKKMAANQFARNSSTVKEGNEVSNELLKQKPNIQQNTNTCMVIWGGKIYIDIPDWLQEKNSRLDFEHKIMYSFSQSLQLKGKSCLQIELKIIIKRYHFVFLSI